MKHRTPFFVAAGFLALVTGCGTDQPATAPTTTSSATSTTPSSTAPTTTTPAAPLLADHPMTARDGTNTALCLESDCEVQVSTGAQIRIGSNNGPATIVIEAASAAGVTLSVYGDSGFTARSTQSGPEAGDLMNYNNVQISLVAARDQECVIRLTR